jgi:hypothetical protein
MAFLPERRRPPSVSPHVWGGEDQYGRPARIDAPQWRPVRRGPSLVPILLTVAFAAATGWLVRSAIEQPRNPRLVHVERHAKPEPTPTQTASVRCSDPDGTIHGWQGNGTGITPHDYFHFLPKCDEGGRR